RLHQAGDLTRRGRDRDPGRLERRDLRLGRAGRAGDDGARVAHALARRRGAAGDERDRGLLAERAHVLGRALLGTAADLADDDDDLGLWILVEIAHGVRGGEAD